MNLLGIETSCDETAAAVVSNGRTVKSSSVSSQIDIHKKYFGVVPELASRAHIEKISVVIDEALRGAVGGIRAIDAIAYTRGPGLAGALLVGQIAAQTLSSLYRIPLIDVNHLEGHMFAALLQYPSLRPPYLSLIVSGGHTELIIVKDFGVYRYLGGTRDDAAGEAFDKVAKLLNLEYPGGPVIDRLASRGDPKAVRFPRPYLWENWDFSFSGLKTAVVNTVRQSNGRYRVEDLCASFQQAVIDTLVTKTVAAAQKFGMDRVVIGGGVAANTQLRDEFKRRGRAEKIRIFLPDRELCTDNAAMIAAAGFYKFQAAGVQTTGYSGIEPNLQLHNWKESHGIHQTTQNRRGRRKK